MTLAASKLSDQYHAKRWYSSAAFLYINSQAPVSGSQSLQPGPTSKEADRKIEIHMLCPDSLCLKDEGLCLCIDYRLLNQKMVQVKMVPRHLTWKILKPLELKGKAPCTIAEVCKLLGFRSYYWRVILVISRITKPIYELLQTKNVSTELPQLRLKKGKGAQQASKTPIQLADEHQRALEHLIDTRPTHPCLLIQTWTSCLCFTQMRQNKDWVLYSIRGKVESSEWSPIGQDTDTSKTKLPPPFWRLGGWSVINFVPIGWVWGCKI